MRGRTGKVRSVVCAMALSFGVGACSEGAPGPVANAVRDSAGVTIIESNSDTRFPVPWDMSWTPVWSVGQLDGDPAYLLDRVEGALQLPGGNVVVANGGTNELRIYSPEGLVVRELGGEGEGPGEFAYLRALGACWADGFIGFDINWQMNSYTWDGTFIDKKSFTAPSGITPYELACDPRGRVVLIGWGIDMSSGPQIGFQSAHDRLVLTSSDGEIETDFGVRLASERLNTRGGSRPHPAGRATRFALHEDRLYVGSGVRFEVEVRELDNSLVALLRGPRISLEVTDSVRSRYLESELEAAASERHAAIRTRVAEMEWPEAVPAFTDLKIDAEGHVWALAFAPSPSDPQVWSVFAPAQGYLGDVALPNDHTLLEAGGNSLLLLARDDLDVERVVKVEFSRGNAS